jgi:hypothetical protein
MAYVSQKFGVHATRLVIFLSFLILSEIVLRLVQLFNWYLLAHDNVWTQETRAKFLVNAFESFDAALAPFFGHSGNTIRGDSRRLLGRKLLDLHEFLHVFGDLGLRA